MTDAALDEDLPPSALYVIHALEELGPSTQRELAQYTSLKKRTVRAALARLRNHDVVDRRPLPGDARQTIYSLSCE